MTELEQARETLHAVTEQLACYEYLCEQKHEEIQKLALELSSIRSQFREACQKVAQLEMARLRT